MLQKAKKLIGRTLLVVQTSNNLAILLQRKTKTGKSTSIEYAVIIMQYTSKRFSIQRLITLNLDREEKEKRTNSKKNKIFLIRFTNTIINPWTVMIHTPNTPTTYTTVMCAFRFNTTAKLLFLIYKRLFMIIFQRMMKYRA